MTTRPKDYTSTPLLEAPSREDRKPVASVIDVFCGAGGLSHGFFLEDYSIACGIDVDDACKYAFEHNNQTTFIHQDVDDLDPEDLNRRFTPGLPRILVGCAPCQPFSQYTQGKENHKWKLLESFADLIINIQPDVVSMENVPQLVKFKDGELFNSFVNRLRHNGYEVESKIAYCPGFGIPQSRSRLVLIASLHGKPPLPEETHQSNEYVTVKDAIGMLPPIESGETHTGDPLHRSSQLAPINIERIKASRPGGTWRDWPAELVTKCHKRISGKGYGSVYGRMSWETPAPTMTTQFYGFGNGRFGHPEQDRAISLREGAIFQTFPITYQFTTSDEAVSFTKVGRLIGNAVPVELARAIARTIKTHLSEVGL